MVNRRISPDLKECALRLWEAGWDEEDICSALLVSRASLFRWRAIFDTFGMVNKPPSPLKGRTRIITRAVLTAVHQLYETTSDLYLDEPSGGLLSIMILSSVILVFSKTSNKLG